MKRCISNLIASAEWKEVLNQSTNTWYKFKVNFVTLTLPADQKDISDKQIKKEVLDVWLKSVKRTMKLGSYFWRAERQKNGNVHFHFVTDTYLPWDKLRQSWNERLERLGFITEFEKKHGHRNPNSTDVHSVQQVANLTNYLIKYCTKDYVTEKDIQLITQMRFKTGSKPHKRALKRLEEILNLSDKPLDGKIWDCSKNLKEAKRCELMLETEALTIWNEERETKAHSLKDADRWSSIVYTPYEFDCMLRGVLKDSYNAWRKSIRLAAAA